jgi:bifunctional DNase/RNase
MQFTHLKVKVSLKNICKNFSTFPKRIYFRRPIFLFFAAVLFGMNNSCSLAKDSSAVRMKIHSLQASMGSAEIAVLLTDEDGKRFLPIAVGGDQALSIQLGRDGRTIKRPLTHDLIANIFKSLEVKVERITITDLRESVYYADIELRQNGRAHHIDARPSDAIALSLRVSAPIYAMPHLLKPISDLPTDEEGDEMPSSTAITAWGMKIQPLTSALADFFGRSEGVLVADVIEPGPALKSGIRPGDIVLRIDKEEIRDIENFLKAMAVRNDTTQVEIGILRGEENLTVVIQNGK